MYLCKYCCTYMCYIYQIPLCRPVKTQKKKKKFLSHGNPEKLENMAEKSFWKLRKAEKAQKDNEELRKPEDQKKSHGKLEKLGISCGKPETDPLLPPS